MLRDKKDEDDADYVPFHNLQKSSVVQESRCFNDAQINTRKCLNVLTKILYLLGQGEKFTKNEATEVFFGVTKLFQSQDPNLRRMMYMVIKELSTTSSEVIIVTASLTKDMNSKTDTYRANALRVLCKITDASMLAQIERHLKQAIVDKCPAVASAALVSGCHMIHQHKNLADVVKRWSNEVQEAVQRNAAPMVQYHALALLYEIKKHDRLAVQKLVTFLSRNGFRSPHAQCLLIQYAAAVLGDGLSSGDARTMYEFLESCLRHKSEMVIFEAAKAITEIKNISARELVPAITVLQLFLGSPKPILRFAAIRTLNRVAMVHPLAVSTCNVDLETLITDSNRSIATLAITTLLKTGSENSVDRLMKQISNFMTEISDEFKVVVVEAVRSLCLKFPAKHKTMMMFLANVLREEGGFDFKKAIVESFLAIVEAIPEAKETGLSYLSEFIEDCEFTPLSTQILNLLGAEGPLSSTPGKYIRFVYNRLILENAAIRAAAVATLAKFGIAVEKLRPSIAILLRRCLTDNDDEVRDRATYYLKMIETDDAHRQYIIQDLPCSIDNLEQALKDYQANRSSVPFDINTVPKTTKPIVSPSKAAQSAPAGGATAASTSSGLSSVANAPAQQNNEYAKLLNSIPEFANLGPLFKSSKPQELTESETEFLVNVVKHVFPEHVVLQFNCTNTLEEQVLDNVQVELDLSALEAVEVESIVPCPRLEYNIPAPCYVCLKRTDITFPAGAFGNVLKFVAKEIDPSTNEVFEDGFEDEYQLEEGDIGVCDFVQGVPVDFDQTWEALGEDFEIGETFELSFRSIPEAVDAIADFLGMKSCKESHVVPQGANTHTLLLGGNFLGDSPVVARADLALVDSSVRMKFEVRSEDEAISFAIASSVA